MRTNDVDHAFDAAIVHKSYAKICTVKFFGKPHLLSVGKHRRKILRVLSVRQHAERSWRTDHLSAEIYRNRRLVTLDAKELVQFASLHVCGAVRTRNQQTLRQGTTKTNRLDSMTRSPVFEFFRCCLFQGRSGSSSASIAMYIPRQPAAQSWVRTTHCQSVPSILAMDNVSALPCCWSVNVTNFESVM